MQILPNITNTDTTQPFPETTIASTTESSQVLTFNITDGNSPFENLVSNPNPGEEFIGQEPDRASFVEWLLGVVGIQQPPDPVPVAPGSCPPCCK